MCWSMTLIPLLNTSQARKTGNRPNMTKKLLTRILSGGDLKGF